MTGTCGCGNDPPSSIKWNFFTSGRLVSFSSTALFLRVRQGIKETATRYCCQCVLLTVYIKYSSCMAKTSQQTTIHSTEPVYVPNTVEVCPSYTIRFILPYHIFRTFKTPITATVVVFTASFMTFRNLGRNG